MRSLGGLKLGGAGWNIPRGYVARTSGPEVASASAAPPAASELNSNQLGALATLGALAAVSSRGGNSVSNVSAANSPTTASAVSAPGMRGAAQAAGMIGNALGVSPLAQIAAQMGISAIGSKSGEGATNAAATGIGMGAPALGGLMAGMPGYAIGSVVGPSLAAAMTGGDVASAAQNAAVNTAGNMIGSSVIGGPGMMVANGISQALANTSVPQGIASVMNGGTYYHAPVTVGVATPVSGLTTMGDTVGFGPQGVVLGSSMDAGISSDGVGSDSPGFAGVGGVTFGGSGSGMGGGSDAGGSGISGSSGGDSSGGSMGGIGAGGFGGFSGGDSSGGSMGGIGAGGISGSMGFGSGGFGSGGDSGGGGSSGGGGGGGGGSRVICTELYKQGLMPRDLYVMDLRFTEKHLSPATVRGYHYWAIPYVRLMRKNSSATKIIRPLALWRAKELAHQMKPEKYKPCYKGKLVRLIWEPICWVIGKLCGAQNWASLYATEEK